MLKARALFYAIIVSVLIALLSGLLITISSLHRLQQIDQFAQTHAQLNISSAVALLTADADEHFDHKAQTLFVDEPDIVWLHKKNWGLFEVASAKTLLRHNTQIDTLEKAFFLGSRGSTITESALYLLDQNEPLVVAGKTYIGGTAYLPTAGIKRGMIGGQSFMGSELVAGKQLKSKSTFPKVESDKMEQLLQDLKQQEAKEWDGTANYVPFTQDPIVIRQSSIYLDQEKLRGNIWVIATDTLVISKRAQLEDIIAYAPTVIVEEGFQGTLQLYARDELRVEPDCAFLYPSILGLLKTSESVEKPFLVLGEGSTMEGALVAYQQQRGRYSPRVKIEAATLIRGQVLVDGQLELKGQVDGHVTAKKFRVRTASASYDNYLWNTSIDRRKLPDFYVAPFFLKEQKGRAVVKWINEKSPHL